jgi:hypothetical protein
LDPSDDDNPAPQLPALKTGPKKVPQKGAARLAVQNSVEAQRAQLATTETTGKAKRKEASTPEYVVWFIVCSALLT